MAMKAGCKFGVRPETEACVNCKHFYQHYIWAESWGFTEIYTGHCAYPRVKNRNVNDCCEHFERKKENEI